MYNCHVLLILHYNTPGSHLRDRIAVMVSHHTCPISPLRVPVTPPFCLHSQFAVVIHTRNELNGSILNTNITRTSDTCVMSVCCEKREERSIFVWDVQKIEREHSNHLSWLAQHLKLFSQLWVILIFFSRAGMESSYLTGHCFLSLNHHKLGNRSGDSSFQCEPIKM